MTYFFTPATGKNFVFLVFCLSTWRIGVRVKLIFPHGFRCGNFIISSFHHFIIEVSKFHPYISSFHHCISSKFPHFIMEISSFHHFIILQPLNFIMEISSFHHFIIKFHHGNFIISSSATLKFHHGQCFKTGNYEKFWEYCFFDMTPQNIQIKYVLTLLWFKIEKTIIYHCEKQQNGSKFEE